MNKLEINKNSYMKKFIQPLLLVVFLFAIGTTSYAEKYRYAKSYAGNSTRNINAAGCNQGASFEFLEVNNVRARFHTGGDMWWNLAGDAAYFIPGSTTKTSLFASALWIGGLDVTGQLKLCAQRFRQDGIDFWTGPLTVDGTASVTSDVCASYDKMFRITKEEVQEFIGWYASTNKEEDYPGYSIPHSIKTWPAHPYDAPGAATYLAPFYDNDGDGEYNPNNGDYPYYDFDNELCPLNFAGIPGWKPQGTMGSTGTPYDPMPTEQGGILSDQVIHGDETLWWVFNDKGNAHTETNSEPIGMEIRAHAFAFATNDEINNMSFLSYEIINRSTFVLTETYFGLWTDPDLGFGKDDYLGCDVSRGMGYCYNGDDVDGTGEINAYGANPPAVGVDFFQGPYMDPDGYDNPGFRHDPLKGPSFHNWTNPCQIVSFHGKEIEMNYGLDENHMDSTVKVMVRAEAINGVNFGNGIVDDERFGMRRFVYFINQPGIQGDPEAIAAQHYNYLKGIWKDNAKMVYGGNGHPSNPGAQENLPADFIFPHDSDPCNWGTNGEQPGDGYNQGTRFWNEITAGNTPEDRRMIQSTGPFTLKPGAVNYITVGIPWARASSGTAWSSVEVLRLVDDKCQALFENCFKVIDGPDAPDLSFVELDKKLICFINPVGNNENESYQEVDNTIIGGDSLYHFEGYQIYQLINETVGPEELTNTDKARLVAQYDKVNGIGRIINFEMDEYLGYNVPVEKVAGSDLGISHSFEITTDKFPIGNDDKLINNRHYYYMAIAYAYNNYKTYNPDSAYLGGQTKLYLSGRNNIRVTTVMPHKTVNGVELHSSYGDIPQITRLEGKGNGGIKINLTQKTIDEIMNKPPASPTNTYGMETYPMAYKAVYEVGSGPIDVKVVDPLNVVPHDYRLKFVDCIEETVKFSKSQFVSNDPVKYIKSFKWQLLDENGHIVDSSVNAITIFKMDALGVSTDLDNDTTKGAGKAQLIPSSYEQILPDLGISVTVTQVLHPGDFWMQEASNNGLISAVGTYSDSSVQWLGGFYDQDEPSSALNWIRSGTYKDISGYSQTVNRLKSDYDMLTGFPWDPYQVYEKILGGSWAPQALAAAISGNHQINATTTSIDENSSYAPNFTHKKYGSLLESHSVDIVLTPDKSKWTRALVIEQSWDTLLSETGTRRFYYRQKPSVDKNGHPYTGPAGVINYTDPEAANYLSDEGMGWFPGYAINIETGERLNIMFGENSYMAANNGRDMLFNPTSNYTDMHGSWVFGGMHFVYVMNSKHCKNTDLVSGGGPAFETTFPAYDGCVTIKKMIDTLYFLEAQYGMFVDVFQQAILNMVYGNCMYIGQPCPAFGQESKWLNNDFKLSIRLMKPYERYFCSQTLADDGFENNHWPLYSFTTKGLEPTYSDVSKIESDLDLINVVPNPYYAYARYEKGTTDNRVRITNLPEVCTITIYNMGGTMVRQFKKSESSTTLDWDLKNFAGVPISGGVYLIHVRNVGSDGVTRDRVIKWFGVIRTVDLFTF